jgi:hypothetical protein
MHVDQSIEAFIRAAVQHPVNRPFLIDAQMIFEKLLDLTLAKSLSPENVDFR